VTVAVKNSLFGDEVARRAVTEVTAFGWDDADVPRSREATANDVPLHEVW
jgi:hypothetical protein